MKMYPLYALLFLFGANCFTQNIQFIPESELNLPADAVMALPEVNFQTLSISLDEIRDHLQAAPQEGLSSLKQSTAVINLPLPNGKFRTFRVIESSVLQPETQARWPQLRTYRILDEQNPVYNGRMSVTTNGVIAFFNSEEGEVIVEPYASGQDRYHAVYYIKDVNNNVVTLPELGCGFETVTDADKPSETDLANLGGAEKTTTSTIKEFIMALTCTGEYAAIKGGTIESVLASFVEGINIANTTFEREVGVRVTLIGNVEQLIYLNAGSDPFVNSDNGGELLSQVRGAITSQGFTTFSYDMGHVFTAGCTDVGGVVGGNTCSEGKDRGVTCHYTGNITSIIRRVFNHEVAHQFGVAHSWYNCPGNQGQLASGSAYEPGSGTTIMSYSGSCQDQNVGGGGNNDYYHGHSVDQFITFITEANGAACATVIPTDNTKPKLTLNYTDGFYIPKSTPFELIAFAEDEQDDPLTYCWEQMDLELIQSPLGEPVGNAPTFRSYPPTTAPNRVFPRLPILVNNLMEITEVLPTYSRDLTFRCTVRDNNPEIGDVAQQDVAFRCAGSAGPFLVMSPNVGDEQWIEGEYREVTWDVANTDNDVVNCKMVNIRLSSDDGYTYPHTLLANTPNNGSAYVFVPAVTGNNMRIRVEAADNIFFDISNESFSIAQATEPTYTYTMSSVFQQVCLPNTAEFSIETASVLDYEGTLSFSIISELPEGVSADFSDASIQAGQSTSLTVDMTGLEDYEGPLELQFRTVAEGQDTLYQNLYFEVIDNDMSHLELLTPAAGAMDVVLEADFSWTPISNAILYDWELSDEADFSNIIDSRYGIPETEISPSVQFENSTLFFWRVRGINECGTGEWQTPRVFHTVNTICNPQTPNDLPILIPGTGPLPTIVSEVFVPFSGTISDMNIPSLRVRYQPIQNFYISLTSPELTEVRLYDQNCFVTDEVRVGFDDEAAEPLDCPPNNGFLYQPAEPLSAFDGENSEGIWTLKVQILETGFGASGELAEWGLEFCAMGTPNSPTMVTNDTLFVPPAMSNTITPELLNVTDGEQSATELQYSLVSTPRHGTLYKVDQELMPGARFTQNTINSFNLIYVNTNPDEINDSFTFVVQDGTGGFVPVQRFHIKMTDDAVVGTSFIEAAQSFIMFPNPTTSGVTIGLEQKSESTLPLRVMDINGRLLFQDQLPGGSLRYELDAQDWPVGIYLVQLGGETQRLVKQ